MQTIKKNWVYYLFVIALITFAISRLRPAAQNVEFKTFQTNAGWGYEVYKNGKLFIRQDNIPGVEGYSVFKTEEDAKKVGALVVKKITEAKTDLPAITPREIDSLQIIK